MSYISPTIKTQNMQTRVETQPSYTEREEYEINGLGAQSVVSVHKKTKFDLLRDQHKQNAYAKAARIALPAQARKIADIAQTIAQLEDDERDTEEGPLAAALLVQSRIMAKLQLGPRATPTQLEARAEEIGTKAYDRAAMIAQAAMQALHAIGL